MFKKLLLAVVFLGLVGNTAVFSKETKTVISDEWIRDVIARYVEGQMPWAEDHIRVDLVGSVERVSVSEERLEYSVVLLDSRGLLGRRVFQIEFKKDGANYKSIKTTADVRVEMEVVALSHPFKKNQIISEDDLYMKKIGLYDLSGSLLFDPGAVIGKRVKRFIKPGTLLTEEMIEEAPLVKKGDRVAIIVESGILTITASGEARMDGAKGKIIEVINSDSKKKIYAEVLGSGRVKVTY
ncbi:MAG: flagellar basal body P-ring formation chaperone FlgA [Nitrospirota bacterium]